jgi:excisionase family DNA binding protein
MRGGVAWFMVGARDDASEIRDRLTRAKGAAAMQEGVPTARESASAVPPPQRIEPARRLESSGRLDSFQRHDDDDVLTVDELVTWLRLSESTVLRLLSERAIPARKVGHQWRIRRGRVRDWLDGRE